MKLLMLTFLMLASFASSASFAKDCDCNGNKGFQWTNNRYKNPSKGGCVSYSAYMDESVFLAKTAKVCGDNIVQGNNVRIVGNAYIYGTAEVNGKNIFIGRDARVGGTAVINSNVKVIAKTLTSGRYSNSEFNGIIERQNEIAAKKKADAERATREHKKKQEKLERERKEKEVLALQAYLQGFRPNTRDLHDFYFSAPCKLNSYGLNGAEYSVDLSKHSASKFYDNATARYIAIYFKNEVVQNSGSRTSGMRTYKDDIGLEFRYGTSESMIEGKLKSTLKDIYYKCRAL